MTIIPPTNQQEKRTEGSRVMKKKPEDNKFHKGNGQDSKHYWLTPEPEMKDMQLRFEFDADGCPYPKPEDFDGLTDDFAGKKSIYFNPPFGSIWHQGPGDKKPKKKGPTAWARQAIRLNKMGKRTVMVYPIDKWVLMMLAAGAVVENMGDVRWVATEDGSTGKGTGRHIARFILEPKVEARNSEDDWCFFCVPNEKGEHQPNCPTVKKLPEINPAA